MIGRKRGDNKFSQAGRALKARMFHHSHNLGHGLCRDWLRTSLVFLTLAIAVWSIERARWITPQPSLMLVLFLAVITGFLLAKWRSVGAADHILVIILGAVVTVWQSASVLPARPVSSLATASFWWQTVAANRPSEGTLYFAILMVLLTWMMGYLSVWFALRRGSVWVTLILGTVTILINLSNLKDTYYHFLFLYLLSAILLLGEQNLARKQARFVQGGQSYPGRSRTYFMAAALSLSILTVSTAWFIPEIHLNPLWQQVGIRLPLREVEAHWLNPFASVPAKWPIIKSDELATLSLAEPVSNSDEILFTVAAAQPSYWRIRRYDDYQSRGWTSNTDAGYELAPGERPGAAEGLNGGVFRYTVENHLKTDVLLAAGEFVSADIPVRVRFFNTGDTAAADRSIVVITAPQMLTLDQSYTVTASRTSYSPAELAQAGRQYPGWVSRYLQLPDGLPKRVARLSEIVTRGADTPFEKAMLVKRFLRELDYNVQADAPPDQTDVVDCFLYAQREGNCNDFASAMVVLLRSAGVPSRLSTGYLPGELDDSSGELIVRSRDYHAWSEVYFPGYGWVEFEATPSRGISGPGADPWLNTESWNLEDTWEASGLGEDYPGLEGFGGEYWDEEELLKLEESEVRFGAMPQGAEWSPTANAQSPDEPGLNLPWATLGFITGLILILWLGLASYRRLALSSGGDVATTAYTRLCLLASMVNLGPEPQQTVLEYAGRLIASFPEQAEAINHITQTYMTTRYNGRKFLSAAQKQQLKRSWGAVRGALLKRLFRMGD